MGRSTSVAKSIAISIGKLCAMYGPWLWPCGRLNRLYWLSAAGDAVAAGCRESPPPPVQHWLDAAAAGMAARGANVSDTCNQQVVLIPHVVQPSGGKPAKQASVAAMTLPGLRQQPPGPASELRIISQHQAAAKPCAAMQSSWPCSRRAFSVVTGVKTFCSERW